MRIGGTGRLFACAAAALPFAGAVIVLAAWGAGPLRLPGVAAGVLAAILAACGRSFPAACLGAAAASVSFGAQVLQGFCPDCAAAAAGFALGGIFCAVATGRRERPAFLAALCAACLVLGAAWAARPGGPAVSAGPEDTLTAPVAVAGAYGPVLPGSVREAGAAGEQRVEAAENRRVREAVRPGKRQVQARLGQEATPAGGRQAGLAELYFSPWCGSCGEAVAAWVYLDPEGRLWRPAAVPERALAEGVKELRGLGYRGAVAAAPASPSGKLPCLRLPDGAVVDGSREVLRGVSVLGRQETRPLQGNP